MTRRSTARTAAAPVVAVRSAVALAVLAVLTVVLPAAWVPAEAAPGTLRVVTVMDKGAGRVDVVVQFEPPPLAPVDPHAASVTPVTSAGTASPGGTASPTSSTSGGSTGTPGSAETTVTPVLSLSAGTPTALVVDASTSGARALPQALSGAAGVMLQLPDTNPITVVADRDPPQLLTTATSKPADGIQALTGIMSSGKLATAQALDMARGRLQPAQTNSGQQGVRLILLTTSGAAPKGDAAQELVSALQNDRIVLGVVATGSAGTSWSDLATSTGGLAVAADPGNVAAGYDKVLAALQARYLVEFARPSSQGAAITVTSAGVPLTTRVDLGTSGSGSATGTPTAGATSSASASAPATASSSSSTNGLGSRLWGTVAILLVVAACIAAVVALRLRRRGSTAPAGPATAATEDDAALLPGVRLFDVSNPRSPTEIDPALDEAYPDQPYSNRPYRGKHREPGVNDAADVDDDGTDDEVDRPGGDATRPDADRAGQAATDRAGSDEEIANRAGEREQSEERAGDGVRPVKEAG